DLVGNFTFRNMVERTLHARNRTAKHGLDGIGGKRIFDRDYEINILQVLLQPALNASIQFIHSLQHHSALSFFVECQHGIAAEFRHAMAQRAEGLVVQQITVECLTRHRARYRSVRTDHPEVEPELLDDGHGEHMSPSRHYDYLDPARMGAA